MLNRGEGSPAEITGAFRQAKAGGLQLVSLTAYDFPSARILEEEGVDFILVGDSLGMVVLGHPDTTQVRLEEVVHHLRAVRRGAQRTIVGADLPARSYDSAEGAVRSARALAEAGADFVKMEGAAAIRPQLEAIAAEGIPLIGHLGMLPQHVLEEGGYRTKGKTSSEAAVLLDEAKLLERIGAAGIVLELIVPEVAEEITRSLSIPTIGIGSGDRCDGQIRVWHDVVGFFPWFTPKFAERLGDTAGAAREAVRAFCHQVQSSR